MKKIKLVILIIIAIAISIIGLKFGIVSSHKSKFTGPVSIEDPLPSELISELEAYVQKMMRVNKAPGVAMALVHGDQVVYSKGFGVSDFTNNEPITTKTLFGIGSITKTITSVVIAELVDYGVFDWDTKVTEILPSFVLSDEEVTDQITMEDTLCMCTGVPRRMEEISVRYEEMSAEDTIESLQTIPLQDTSGGSFNYSSRMVASGGYIAALASGGEYGNLAQAYNKMVKEQLLDPLEMTASTFSIEEAVASGNYAVPHYSALSGMQAISPDLEGIFTPIAPAGAMWSNVEDMAKFVIMLLKDGTLPDGREIISSESLVYVWEPRVEIDPNMYYGLGWNIEDYNGLRVYFHPGGTVGFASELVIIPDLEIGFVLLTNQLDQVSPIGRLATYRLLEMLTGSEQVYDHEIGKAKRNIELQLLQLHLVTKKKVKEDKIAPFLGNYHNDVLGEIELVLHDDNTLWIDFGEYESSIRPLLIEDNQYIFFESVFVGKTLTMKLRSDGGRIIQWRGDEAFYSFSD